MVTALSESDLQVLEHVARYRLTLPSILAQSAILDGEGVPPASVLERLTSIQMLSKGELLPGVPETELYYSLAPRGAITLGRDPASARPLKRDARIEAFAIATFCCSGPVERHLFTRDEFLERFDGIWYPGQPLRYCLEYSDAGEPRLAFLRVDLDGFGRWDRLIDSCSRFIRQRTDVDRAAPEHRGKVETYAPRRVGVDRLKALARGDQLLQIANDGAATKILLRAGCNIKSAESVIHFTLLSCEQDRHPLML